MRLYRDLNNAPLSPASVVTIGNFDGVHRGHQALLRRCVELAEDSLECAVVTFEPLPLAWFRPGQAPARLSSPRQKIDRFRNEGMDLVWMLRFNRALAALSAREFAQTVLADALCARHVVIGDDFRFGRNREGDLGQLQEFGQQIGFEVQVVPEVLAASGRISSSAVRRALGEGDFQNARELLGRPWCLSGKVFHGAKMGRQLGYPTANIKPAARPCPVAGVFAVQARIGTSGEWRDGVASLGVRPAVGGGEFLVEVHLFDFELDLYGKRLKVRMIEKLRDEADFDSMDALVAQMRQDELKARQILGCPLEYAG